MCDLSRPRSYKLITETILWLHLLASLSLLLGTAVEDTEHSKKIHSYGIMKFYVLCFSALMLVPILLALHGVYKKSPFFIAPYIVSLGATISLSIMVLIVIILGMVLDPRSVTNTWSPPKTSFNQTMVDIWLTTVGIAFVIVIKSVWFFFVFSHYKILIKHDQMKRLTYIETTNITHQAANSLPMSAATAPNETSRLTAPPTLPDDKEDEDPPPSYSRTQSTIGYSYA